MINDPMRNPFFLRREITDPRSFYGRANLVRELLNMVASRQSCAVVGEESIGKSSLLAYLAAPKVQAAHDLDPETTLAARIDFLGLQSCSPRKLWTEILKELTHAARDRTEESRRILETASDGEKVSLRGLRRSLQTLRTRGFQVVLLCDVFEKAVKNPRLDRRVFGNLRSISENEGVAFVTTSRLSLLELDQYLDKEARQEESPFFNVFSEFSIGPFEDHEVAEMLAGSLAPTPIRFAHEDTEFLDHLAGRHPYFLQLTAYHIFDELESAGIGRTAAGRIRDPHHLGDTGLAEIRLKVWERVRRQAARLFRRQWQLSSQNERQTLIALAPASGEHPSMVGGKFAEHVKGLERRGLVLRDRNNNGSAPSYRLFSELLADWIRTNGIGEEPGSGNDT